MPEDYPVFHGPVQIAASLLSQWVPIVAFYVVWRSGRRTKGRLIGASAIAGAVPIGLWVICAWILAIIDGHALRIMLAGAFIPGTLVGIAGVVITSFVSWLMQRERRADAR